MENSVKSPSVTGCIIINGVVYEPKGGHHCIECDFYVREDEIDNCIGFIATGKKLCFCNSSTNTIFKRNLNKTRELKIKNVFE